MNVRPMRPKFVTLAVRSVDVSDVCGCEQAGDSIMFRDAPRWIISVGSTIIEESKKVILPSKIQDETKVTYHIAYSGMRYM